MTENSTAKIKDIIFDDGEKIEIESSHPDADSAIKALHDDPRYK